MARVSSQQEDIDYEETFAPIARYTTMRSLISLATTMGWNIHQMDVKTTSLNVTLEEEVYIEVRTTRGFCGTHQRHPCVQVEESFVQAQVGSQGMV